MHARVYGENGCSACAKEGKHDSPVAMCKSIVQNDIHQDIMDNKNWIQTTLDTKKKLATET